MSYASHQQMIDRFGEDELIQLTDRFRAGVIDGVVLDLALADADGEIDGYLKGGGYALPLSPVPTVVARIAADIARYRLYSDAATDQVRQAYEDARRMLEAIAAGRISLGVSDEVTTPAGRVVVRTGESNTDWSTH